jgi:hypothetical protein
MSKGTGQIRVLRADLPRASTGMLNRCCLPVWHANVLQVLLCTTMWITCVKRRRACAHIGEMLGIPLPGSAMTGAFTWECTIHVLWTERKAKLSTRHAAIAHK